MTEPTGYLIGKLETLLADGFSASGDGLDAKLRSVGAELPDDLRELLQQLAEQSQSVNQEDAIPFAFRCGQAHERLEALVQSRLAANIAFLDADGTPPLELEKSDLDAIARFVELRNRFLATVADYTLKFLLVSAILLALGLSLGLI